MTDIGPHVEAHLADLFENGKEHTVVYPGKPETTVWIERPSPDQHEECLRKSRAARARRYHELMDEDSAERLALIQEVEAMNKEQVVDGLLEGESRNYERQALNDVLFSEDYGSDWGSEGEKWSEVLEALSERLTEIDEHNRELKAANADEEALIRTEKDEEVLRLSEIQEMFEAEVKERRDELVKDRRNEIAISSVEKLREDLIEHRINLDCDMVWFTTFKFEQLYRAVRYRNDHTQLYFKSASQIRQLPRVVQEQLMDGLNEVDINLEALKNSLTPELS